ncbi:hypothetical protein J3E71DRAFT_239318 [Bipolaris maydis]|nr:hypothetical protein J3E71DRAFT_239318 [Bipolaris maydis]
MRGAFIFALATLVAPTLTAAVPAIGTTSLHVEADVKRDTESFNTDQLEPRNIQERPIIPGTVLGRTVLAEPTEALFKRQRGVGRPRTGNGDYKKRAENPVEPRGRVKWNQKREPESSESPVEPRGRVKWNQKREPESSESPVEPRGRVKWNQKREPESSEDVVERRGRVKWNQ